MENANLLRIQTVSRRFRIFFSVLIPSLPIFTLVFWLMFNYVPPGFKQGLPVATDHAFSISTQLLAALVSMIPISVAVYGANLLKKLFRLYETGMIFCPEAANHFKQLGHSLFYWVLANLIYTPLISVVLSLHNPPGERLIVAQFGSPDIATLITGAIVLLISWVMKEASSLEEEQAHTI